MKRPSDHLFATSSHLLVTSFVAPFE